MILKSPKITTHTQVSALAKKPKVFKLQKRLNLFNSIVFSSNAHLVDSLKRHGVVRDDRVAAVMKSVDRGDFCDRDVIMFNKLLSFVNEEIFRKYYKC